MSSRCPKCNEKIKPTYLKPTCPKCGANMLYYKLDEQLEEDAKKAQAEVEAVNKFINMLKDSTIKTPLHIIRLILFFTPLASMCLPMFWAGHKNVSLITFIMSIINHGFDLGAMASDKSYLFAVLAMICVIIFSIVEIICSLFSSAKGGYKRYAVAYFINEIVLVGCMFVLCILFDGNIKIGFVVTFIIYQIKWLLTMIIERKNLKETIIRCGASCLCGVLCFYPLFNSYNSTICTAINDCEISVVSFNVASAFGTKLEDTDSMERCDRFANYVKEYDPDFIGTQEMNSYWLTALEEKLDGYEAYGVKRGGDSEEKNSEMNAIFFKKEFKVVDENTIWLSETPDVESKYTYTDEKGEPAEAGCNRVCTYAVVLSGKTYSSYAFMNTHLDNASEQARVFGASVILDEIEKLQNKYDGIKIILTGDFNETSDDEAYKLLSSRLNDTTDDSKAVATYQEWGYRNTGDMPIDFIFTTGNAQNYEVLDNLDNGYISDHYGIYSEINF